MTQKEFENQAKERAERSILSTLKGSMTVDLFTETMTACGGVSVNYREATFTAVVYIPGYSYWTTKINVSYDVEDNHWDVHY